MRLRPVLLASSLAPAIALAQIQVVGDDACPTYAVDIAAFATCDGDRVAAPTASPPLTVATLPAFDVPAYKQSDRGLHVAAAEAYRVKQMHPREVVLLDIRSRTEAVYVGQPDGVDIHVPYLEPMSPPQWNAAANGLKMQRNPAFVDEVKAELDRLGAGPDSPILLLCRSGERSAIAADVLAAAGLPRVYTIVDGFEGDIGASGKRDVNGWRNSGAPWQARPIARLIYRATTP
jgi:rhodanese-related sulfurtransferase